MRMATFGHIEPFPGVCEDFELYIERLEQNLVTNDLDAIALSEDQSNQTDSRDAKRCVIGPQTHSLLHNIMSPDKPATKTYSELVKKLHDHFVPKPTETVQCFKFHCRYRHTGESIADFVSELLKLSRAISGIT